ncbi:hypothetical protein VKT23_018226 [Stygiomarasmius scandens]|uniref:Uncharacterized protein n=1 Tax=Marasmiellus scandens TaxID=2682957 RepID=A0ABR1IS45_9AGAR
MPSLVFARSSASSVAAVIAETPSSTLLVGASSGCLILAALLLLYYGLNVLRKELCRETEYDVENQRIARPTNLPTLPPRVATIARPSDFQYASTNVLPVSITKDAVITAPAPIYAPKPCLTLLPAFPLSDYQGTFFPASVDAAARLDGHLPQKNHAESFHPVDSLESLADANASIDDSADVDNIEGVACELDVTVFDGPGASLLVEADFSLVQSPPSTFAPIVDPTQSCGDLKAVLSNIMPETPVLHFNPRFSLIPRNNDVPAVTSPTKSLKSSRTADKENIVPSRQ